MALDARSLLGRMMIGNLDAGLFLVMRPNPQSFQKTCSKIINEQLTNSGWVSTHWGNQRDTITVSGVTASKIGNPNQYKKSEYLGADSASYINSFTSDSGTAKHGPRQWADIDRFMLKLEQIYKLDKERIGSLGDVLTGNHITTGTMATLSFPSLFFKNGKESIKSKTEKINENRTNLVQAIKNGTASRAQSFIIYDYCIYWGYFTAFSYNQSATDKPRQYSYSFTFKVVNSTTDWLSQSLINNFPEARILNFFSQVGQNVGYVASMLTSSDKILKGIMI